mmetsp:Transcript_28979/g.62336  ORF Transcript_28979/g.62336 Transcript_28979/m.62336 type:complete len:332 (-) Transcript_28979:85-1080(-)
MEAVRTLVLNPASALATSVACLLMHLTHTSPAMLFNPWGLGVGLWLGAYAAVRIALLGFVDGSVWLIGPLLPPLPSRTGPKPVFQHRIISLDVSYLAINSVIEFVFTQQLAMLLWHSPLLIRTPSALGLLNGPAALWLLLVVDDALYAPLHRLMHHPAVYRHVHKHHHRNTFPARGYIDGANEHPVEQLSALCLHWLAMHIVAASVGLHVAAVGLHLGFKALGACFNHTGYDLQLCFLGIDYSVRAHEMHHRKPNTNFAQYVMFWDRLMGTYQEYDSGIKAEESGPASPGRATPSQAEPARLSAWADPAVEAATGHLRERPTSATKPSVAE